MAENDQTKKVVQEADYNEVLNKNLAYINEHRANVKKALDKLVELKIIDPNTVIYESVRENIYKHDLSKYQVEEFESYARRFFIENGRELHKEEFDLAWLHHIHNNPHHWNYWVLVDGKNEIKALEMPVEYVWEMICDWLSFSIKSGNLKEIKDFNEKKRGEYIFHPATREFVDMIIEAIVLKVEELETEAK